MEYTAFFPCLEWLIQKDPRIGTPELADFPAQADMQEVLLHTVAHESQISVFGFRVYWGGFGLPGLIRL